MTEFLIARGRIGCVPGVDFGANGEGYIRFCFARDRAELTGALDSMRTLFAGMPAMRSRQRRCRPPSMRSVSPVTKSDSSR